jgi:hypothetical protein
MRKVFCFGEIPPHGRIGNYGRIISAQQNNLKVPWALPWGSMLLIIANRQREALQLQHICAVVLMDFNRPIDVV